jgi:U4/U6.U5 tri-snRNP-associated protein 1
MRKRRQMERKLHASKGLGDPEEDESASLWVERMRMREEEKKMAEQRAKMLEEMDEEFGVEGLIQDSIMDHKQKAYTSRDLSGLKVEHGEGSFAEGQTVILTLKDAPVLEEGGDVLENVNILDKEKADRNVELKKKSLGYEGYQDEFDEMGMLKEKKILSKYDEEIEGVKKESMMLGYHGSYNAEEERERRLVQQRLSSGAVSLETAPATIAREYYTEEEMVKFKKPKKRKKVKKSTLKADDLVPLDGGVGEETRDHGSRGLRHHHHDEDDDMVVMETEDIKPIITEDEDKSAIDRALQRTREMLDRKKNSQTSGAEKVVEMVSAGVHVKKEPLFSSDAIVLDTTAEFCRQLGEDTVQAVTRRTSVPAQTEEMDVTAESRGNWEEVTMETESEPTVNYLIGDCLWGYQCVLGTPLQSVPKAFSLLVVCVMFTSSGEGPLPGGRACGLFRDVSCVTDGHQEGLH